MENINKAASWYTDRLNGVVITPTVPEDFYSSWAQYTIRLESKTQRDMLQNKLKDAGIPSMIYYPRGMHQQQVFKNMLIDDSCYENTCKAVDTVLSLPMHPYLDEDTVDMICNSIIDYLK